MPGGAYVNLQPREQVDRAMSDVALYVKKSGRLCTSADHLTNAADNLLEEFTLFESPWRHVPFQPENLW